MKKLTVVYPKMKIHFLKPLKISLFQRIYWWAWWFNVKFLQIWRRNKLINILDGLRLSTFSANFHFGVNYSFKMCLQKDATIKLYYLLTITIFCCFLPYPENVIFKIFPNCNCKTPYSLYLSEIKIWLRHQTLQPPKGHMGWTSGLLCILLLRIKKTPHTPPPLQNWFNLSQPSH